MTTDCDGCEAPCCNNLFVTHSHPETGEVHEEDRRQVIETWRDAGATLVPIRFSQEGFMMWECSAFSKELRRCSVWEKRPETCRRYDCTEDPYAYQNPALCLWPRTGKGRDEQ